MLRHIRPVKLFRLYKTESFYDRMANIVLPGENTPMLIETAVLLTLGKLIKPTKFFEFGTYKGIHTLDIVANIPEIEICYTLDLDQDSFKKAMQHPIDKKISQFHFEYEDKLAFLNTPYEEKVRRLYGDSNVFDFSEFYNCIDMIYIDGGHDSRTLQNDTENSFKMLSKSQPSCIAWHDYDNPDYRNVKDYIQKLSETKNIFHVKETRICFFLNDPKTYFVNDLIQ